MLTGRPGGFGLRAVSRQAGLISGTITPLMTGRVCSLVARVNGEVGCHLVVGRGRIGFSSKGSEPVQRAPVPSRGDPPRERFVTLDALRGVGALVVVAHHYGTFTASYIPRFSYLSVDLFYVLSGFVLAYANDKRFANGITARSFFVAKG